MKLGFICPNVPGHINPMTALARQLQARSHEVVFLYSSGAAGAVRKAMKEKGLLSDTKHSVTRLRRLNLTDSQ